MFETEDDRKLGDDKIKEGLVNLRKFYDSRALSNLNARPQSCASTSSAMQADFSTSNRIQLYSVGGNNGRQS